MTYRPPGVAPRGRWARFLHQMRKDRGWSQQQGFEALREGLHFGPKSRASYSAIDMGKRPPTPTEAEFLIAYFGKGPDDIDLVDEPEAPDLAQALSDLAKELAAIRLERIAWQRGWAAIVRAAGEGRVPLELLDALVPPLPEGAQQ